MAHAQHNCLNCSTSLTGKYCVNCGQKADTHRITTRHFLSHDLLHGTFHIEKGLFYTILQVFKKRGRSAAEYISGKRVSYYNVFYLSLLLLGLNIFLVVYRHKIAPETVIERSGSFGSFYDFAADYIKFIILGFIPLFAFNMFVLFRRKRHNYAEHIIAAGFCMVGCLVIAAVNNMVRLIGNYDYAIFPIIDITLSALMLLTPAFFYYPYVRPEYKFGGYLWRIVVFYIALFIQLIFLVLMLTYMANGSFDMEGQLMIS